MSGRQWLGIGRAPWREGERGGLGVGLWWPYAIGVPVGCLTPCRLRAAAGKQYRPALPGWCVCVLPVACPARVSLAHARASRAFYMQLCSNRYAAVSALVTAMQPLLLCSDRYAAVARVAVATFLQLRQLLVLCCGCVRRPIGGGHPPSGSTQAQRWMPSHPRRLVFTTQVPVLQTPRLQG